jgi:TolB protein
MNEAPQMTDKESSRQKSFCVSRRELLSGIASLGIFSGVSLPQALAQKHLIIPGGAFVPLPIALPNFVAGTPSDGEVSIGVTQVITNNLKRSGLFAPIDQEAYIGRIVNIDAPPQFPELADHQRAGAANGQHDPPGRRALGGQIPPLGCRHRPATGRSAVSHPTRELAADRAHHLRSGLRAPHGGEGLFRYSRSVRRRDRRQAAITYMEFGQGDPRVYLLNIETGQSEIVGNFPGMTFSPRFSPDGQRVIMSLQRGGNSNLFVMDLRSKSTTRLTDTPAIDTAPSYSPDGSRICFESDRGGKPQIYVMPATGGPAQRISFDEVTNGTYSTPVWSPRDDYIAFIKQGGGQFSIGIMKPDGSGERILTSGFHDEGPTFAPNGRVLMFSRDPGGEVDAGPSLYTVDISGRFDEQLVPTPAFASDPAWSPLLS